MVVARRTISGDMGLLTDWRRDNLRRVMPCCRPFPGTEEVAVTAAADIGLSILNEEDFNLASPRKKPH